MASNHPQLEQRNTTTEPSRRFIKLPEVKALTTLSTSELYRRIAAGTFPAQISLGPKSVVWELSQIQKWCDARVAESRDEVANG